MELLTEADPSEARVNEYLSDSWCFAAFVDNTMVGVCVTKQIHPGIGEIFNIAVRPESQKKGIGTQLIKYTLAQLAAKSIKVVMLGTGTFGYQLAFYQRLGFRVESVIKDFFLDNYEEPLFEQGIQLKDMLRLYLELT
ncbi:MAG: GNAT family N-acetyltransferase [Candidatus Latescibacteria bacterium]|nr:GNAT family N-acetyltransferase [Candidatus Latescibacterota bacterium]